MNNRNRPRTVLEGAVGSPTSGAEYSPYYALRAGADGLEVLVAFQDLESRVAHLDGVKLRASRAYRALGHPAVIAGTQQRHRDVTGPETRRMIGQQR